jgi:hypothetical protein
VFKKYLIFNLGFIAIFLVQLLQTSNLLSFPTSFLNPAFTFLASLMLIFETKLRGRFHRRVLFAFICLLIGTLLLVTPKNTHLNYVLLSLLTSQICLVRAFYLDFSSAPELDKFGARVAILFGILFSFTAYLYLRPYLGSFKIGGLIYTFMTTLVMMMASFRRFRVDKASFLLILSASIVFAGATVMFAIDYFVGTDATYKLAANSMYMLGLYLMTVGAVERRLVVVAP